jgi:DNA-binding FrmR family transcriptional regulator
MDENSCNLCSSREAHHSEKVKKELLTRVNRIEGQIRGVGKMIENNIYCDDILNQITSIRAALAGLSKQLLEEHIKTCITEKIKNNDSEAVAELLETIRKIIK